MRKEKKEEEGRKRKKKKGQLLRLLPPFSRHSFFIQQFFTTSEAFLEENTSIPNSLESFIFAPKVGMLHNRKVVLAKKVKKSRERERIKI